jgi:hypothetical protein
VYASAFRGNLFGNVLASSITVGNISVSGNAITLSGNPFATQAWTTSTINTAGRNSQGTKVISTSPPSGAGTNGDIWYQI